MACPPDSQLQAVLAATSFAARAGVLDHLDGCELCVGRVAAMAWSGEPTASSTGLAPTNSPSAELLSAGSRVDRLVVIEAVGRGAMGMVYKAYDPRLDRVVALKEMRRLGQVEALRREAQALARVIDPHVVTVHDLLEDQGRAWLVMEYVRGTSVSRWLATSRPPLSELLKVFRQLALGLAAVHESGLVHCDVKPANMLLGDDGRGRLTDFGLARLQGEAALGGTPQYMAPEQRKGAGLGLASQAADQYAFCRSLEAALEPGPAPRALRALLKRGLAAEPARRFASMRELLAHWPRPRRLARQLWLGAGLALGLAAVGLAFWEQATACSDGATRFGRLLPPERRAQLGRALLNSPAAARLFGAWEQEWVAHYQDACQTARAKNPVGPQQVQCLQQRLVSADAALDAVAQRPEKAIDVMMALPPVRGCLAPYRESPSLTEVLERAQPILARARLAFELGEFSEAEGTLARLDDGPYRQEPPLQVERSLLLAQLANRRGEIDAAVKGFTATYANALAAGHDAAAVRAALGMVLLEGVEFHRLAESSRWASHAAALTERLGRPDELMLALGEYRAHVAAGNQAPAEAVAAWREVLERAPALWGARHPKVGRLRCNAARALHLAGDAPGAREAFSSGLEVMVAAYGADAPRLAVEYGNFSQLEIDEGNAEAALLLARKSRERFAAMLGQGHWAVGRAYAREATAALLTGRSEEAAAHLQQARSRLGGAEPDPELLADVLVVEGELAFERGDRAGALALGQRVLALRTMPEIEASDRDRARFLIARSLPPQQLEEARAQASLALTEARARGATAAQERVAAWLTAQEPRQPP